MKKIVYNFGLSLLLAFTIAGCQDEDFTLGDIVAPTNLQIDVDIVGADANNPNGDGSGTVNFKAKADGAISYQFVYNGVASSAPNGEQSYDFAILGLNTYTVTAIAFGTAGASTSKTIEVEVLSLYEPPAELLTMLTADSSREWRIKAEGGKHFGLGPVGGAIPCEWYGASPNEKAGTGMYDDRYIFNSDGTFTHITNATNDDPTPDTSGTVFGRQVLIEELNGPGGTPNGADIENYPLNDYTAQWSLSAPGGIETISLTGTAFMGYYIGGDHKYEIFSRSANEMQLRITDGNNEFDWWFILTAEGAADTGFETQYTNLVWEDNFDVNGAPNASNWTYDLGAGGWGNDELQTYTNSPDNVVVEDGFLKITARKGGDELYYFDEIKIVDGGGTPQSTIQDFEGTAPTFTDFGGATSTTVANPDASGVNTTANVGQLTKGVGAEVWAGSFFELGSPLDFSTNKRISVRTWSPKSGIVVKLKLENADASIAHEVDLNTTTSNTWEELIFDFSAAPSASYVRVVIFFDFGNSPAAYTSARIKSENLFEFTYGRVEVRAKLPAAQGTWPAIWMLGANFDTVGWPDSGEIDIMEQTGQDKSTISGTLHYPAVSPGTGNTASTSVSNPSSEFHNYSVEWTPDQIYILVDDVVFHNVPNTGDLPFHSDFFMVLNLAMGGSLGGDIDPAFSQDTFEIDYVRVYQ